MHTLNTQSMSDSIYLYQCHRLHLHSQCLLFPHTNSLTFPSCSLPFHNVSSLVLSIPFHIQHLKPFTFTSGEMCCHALMILIDWIINLYFLVYKLTWIHEDSQFSLQNVLVVVLRILNTCVLDFCVVSVVWSFWVCALFMVFNLWVGPGFILSLVVNFNFSIVIFLLQNWTRLVLRCTS